jgi:hypothetical protein
LRRRHRPRSSEGSRRGPSPARRSRPLPLPLASRQKLGRRWKIDQLPPAVGGPGALGRRSRRRGSSPPDTRGPGSRQGHADRTRPRQRRSDQPRRRSR